MQRRPPTEERAGSGRESAATPRSMFLITTTGIAAQAVAASGIRPGVSRLEDPRSPPNRSRTRDGPTPSGWRQRARATARAHDGRRARPGSQSYVAPGGRTRVGQGPGADLHPAPRCRCLALPCCHATTPTADLLAELNPRQQIYLTKIYYADQSAEPQQGRGVGLGPWTAGQRMSVADLLSQGLEGPRRQHEPPVRPGG